MDGQVDNDVLAFLQGAVRGDDLNDLPFGTGMPADVLVADVLPSPLFTHAVDQDPALASLRGDGDVVPVIVFAALAWLLLKGFK